MSKNKLVKFVEMLWGCYHDRFTPNDKDKAMLAEIKKKLEIYEQLFGDESIKIQEQSPPPGENLVEKVLQIGVDYWHNVGKFAPGQPHKIESDEAKSEIRKLLQGKK